MRQTESGKEKAKGWETVEVPIKTAKAEYWFDLIDIKFTL